MTSAQAHEVTPTRQRLSPALRPYALNSPRAKARLVVIAMLVDGRLDDAELERLTQHEMFAELGITREGFFEVFYDFCADLEEFPKGSGDYLISRVVLESAFAEIMGVAEQRNLLRLIFDMIRSDGDLSNSEVDLCWHLVDSWEFRAEDMRIALKRERQCNSRVAVTQETA